MRTSSTTPDLSPLANELLIHLQRVELKLDQLHNLLAGQRKDHYTVEEVAAAVGRAEYTIRRWIKEKRLIAIRINGTGDRGRLLVPRQELEKLVTSGLGTTLADTHLVSNTGGLHENASRST